MGAMKGALPHIKKIGRKESGRQNWFNQQCKQSFQNNENQASHQFITTFIRTKSRQEYFY